MSAGLLTAASVVTHRPRNVIQNDSAMTAPMMSRTIAMPRDNLRKPIRCMRWRIINQSPDVLEAAARVEQDDLLVCMEQAALHQPPLRAVRPLDVGERAALQGLIRYTFNKIKRMARTG